MTEHRIMNKPSRSFAKPLRDLVGKAMGETFRKQGFASAELVTRWTEIVGAEIAAHSRADQNPMDARRPTARSANPARWCCGSRARRRSKFSISTNVICERVNRFLGWRAIAPHRVAPGAAAARGAQGGKDQRSGRGRAGGRELAGYRRRRFTAGAGPAWRRGQTRLTRGQHQPTVTCRALGGMAC